MVADTGSGHNGVATVFLDCGFQHRIDGPAEPRSVGEVEAVADLAKQCAADNGRLVVTQLIVTMAGVMISPRDNKYYPLGQWRSQLSWRDYVFLWAEWRPLCGAVGRNQGGFR